MEHQEILNRVDHTILTTTATWEQVKAVCDEGLAYSTASVCIPPRYVKKAADYVAYLHRGKLVLQGAKDELLDEYGRLVCTRGEMDRVDPAFLVGRRESAFQCEALVRDKREFRRRYPELAVDPVSLEDLMVFTVRGDRA